MFRPLDSLQFRVTAALALFVAVMATLIVLALFAINERLENDLLDGIVAHELGELEAEYPIEGEAALPNSATIKAFVVEPDALGLLPEALRPLPRHSTGVNLSYGGRSYRVATTIINGKRAYLTYDMTAIEAREAVFRIALIVAVIIVFALALPLGIWIARISLKPINQLAEHVARLEPGAPGEAMAERFDGYEVGAIARAFDRFMQRLDGFVERERSFTADASHELRTPLAVIQGALEVLRQDPRFTDSAPLMRIERASRQMADLIESLLFLARDESSNLSSEQHCRADIVVGELLDAYRPILGNSTVQVAAMDHCPVAAPRIALVIVFGNLLRNAMRHGGPNIRVTLADNVLSVADDGPGMDAEQRRQAFERGYRYGRGAGLGLGLYLVQRVAHRYDWHLRLTSRPDEGTRVEVRFARL
ncbi:Two-component system sensor protein [Salinisphaera shabanensis E1L3A]|uniref:histidine kinase n=1 Tax=Salinisphaera shabanensis E1L3A TaxID=1033802 RepID=U2ER26_9GAMM|nr:HAMP domain-containing sensor histidine kinase [Salinisphaera shabanensis]ERJ20487.1 Two-component system sensor protein [Salinisphaera shabanensis E1L3A]